MKKACELYYLQHNEDLYQFVVVENNYRKCIFIKENKPRIIVVALQETANITPFRIL